MLNKKVSVILLLIVTWMLIYATSGFAISNKIKVIIDSKEIPSDVSPMMVSGRVMVPLRAVSNAMGAKLDWNPATETITLSKNSDVIILKVGDKKATINGKLFILDVPATIVKDRTLVPIRFIGESFGAQVIWDEKNQTVTIQKPSSVPIFDKTELQNAITMGAIMKKVNGLKVNVLGGEPNSQQLKSIKTGLLDAWDITDKQSALGTISWLKTEGHTAELGRLMEVISGTPENDFEQLLNKYKDDSETQRKLKFLKNNQDYFFQNSLKGWDYCRLINVAEYCYDVGYLSYYEAASEIIAASRVLENSYLSWEAVGKNYLMGGLFWEGPGQSHDNRVAAYNWLLTDPQSPWVVSSWPSSKTKIKDDNTKTQIPQLGWEDEEHE